MKKDTELWLQYADENLQSARILLDSWLYNPSLQNSQQAVEKYLKALLIEKAAGLARTHSIRELTGLVSALGVQLTMSDDDIDLLDSIYLPSKYPAFSALPKFMPDHNICKHTLEIAERARQEVLAAFS